MALWAIDGCDGTGEDVVCSALDLCDPLVLGGLVSDVTAQVRMADLDPMHFDGLAQAYAAARPPYPAVLWRDVHATGLVTRGRRALDLGAGSGQATGELLARGVDVVAVEPGPQLAEALAKRHPDATVIRSRAEDIRPDAAAFELAAAGTSIHWMDLDVVLPIVHRVDR